MNILRCGNTDESIGAIGFCFICSFKGNYYMIDTLN